MSELPSLLGVFSYLSLLTVGGGMAAFPELKDQTVEVHAWLTFPQLVHLYSVGQLAPGPNMMMIVPIGDWAAGPLGAAAVLLAFFAPTALLTFLVGRWWVKLAHWPWRTSIQSGLAPVAIGLLLAGCFTMAKGAIFGLETAAIAAGVLLVLLSYKINPALLVLGGAAVGLISF
ncbi:MULTISPECIES: chromate transporter [unclassified Chelatococcus]|uniref:chromate transporter n=1 Tax=unclassified Chelatococcus TaxID=2638111 RepID=UPI001BCA9203|nr:chromate transporter [Chelatococcus sp.]MBS7740289.1 chromate transporter [Chelatococcus sp. HY11]CAH1654719.1 Chromate transport protein ChrA [Hyphomicrobiales bacterium]MBX3544881.1 chromate transporter [Chelatococcus sp.]MCO5078470.1 chromate transporter [Chelatococcus sp.]CAH1685334.1 Chromate transport protein ChrA [Hyphomicrobiales bacterium]